MAKFGQKVKGLALNFFIRICYTALKTSAILQGPAYVYMHFKDHHQHMFGRNLSKLIFFENYLSQLPLNTNLMHFVQ